MYSPTHFTEDRKDILFGFLRENPLGALVSSGPDGFFATHAPMRLDIEKGVLQCHVARANPHWRYLADSPDAMVIFSGPSAYITPSWYQAKKEHGKVVPTWNYAAVHVWGRARIFEDAAWLSELVRKLTDEHEAQFEQPWSVNDAPADYIESMFKAIVGIEIPIERIAGKWKLSQNRSEADQAGVVAGLGDSKIGEMMKKK